MNLSDEKVAEARAMIGPLVDRVFVRLIQMLLRTKAEQVFDEIVEQLRKDATPPPQPSVSEGSVVRVTKAMREAGLAAAGICIRETSKANNVRLVSVSDVDCEAIFLAMLAAAPSPTKGDK